MPEPLPTPSAGGSSFHNARTANEMLKAQERKLRLDERRGQLVEKARALMLVHRLAKEERDAILAWPARIAAELAAELGVDAHRLQTLMDARLRQHLAERNDVRVAVA
jgi:citrate lyase beta subunit